MARADPPEPTQDPDPRLQESFEAFYLRMYPTMFLMARRRCGDKDADDLVQEVMYRLLKRWDAIEPPTRDNYAFTAVRNAVISRRARASTWREILEFDTDGAEVRGSRPHVNPVEQVVDGNDLAIRVFEYISSELSAREQDVILMFVTGLTPAEIAGQLGLDASTVRTVLSRARKKLRDFLRAQEGGPL